MTDKQANRPILPIPRSPSAAVLEIVAVAGTVLSVALLVQSWKALPPVIPVHFGISGKPDGWGAKPTLWLFPALSAAIYVGLTVLSRFPHTFNYPVPITEENALQQYRLACELQELAEGGTDLPVWGCQVGDDPGGFGQGGGTGCGVCAGGGAGYLWHGGLLFVASVSGALVAHPAAVGGAFHHQGMKL